MVNERVQVEVRGVKENLSQRNALRYVAKQKCSCENTLTDKAKYNHTFSEIMHGGTAIIVFLIIFILYLNFVFYGNYTFILGVEVVEMTCSFVQLCGTYIDE